MRPKRHLSGERRRRRQMHGKHGRDGVGGTVSWSAGERSVRNAAATASSERSGVAKRQRKWQTKIKGPTSPSHDVASGTCDKARPRRARVLKLGGTQEPTVRLNGHARSRPCAGSVSERRGRRGVGRRRQQDGRGKSKASGSKRILEDGNQGKGHIIIKHRFSWGKVFFAIESTVYQ